ncbi:MAG TPA: hypothetical protein VF259_06030 [Solirubrobacterales bacterium]
MAELGALFLPIVPLLVLVAFLLAGRYPGCDAMVRLGERIASRSRDGVAALRRQSRPRRPARRSVHGGLLLAFALSGRAPPA